MESNFMSELFRYLRKHMNQKKTKYQVIRLIEEFKELTEKYDQIHIKNNPENLLNNMCEKGLLNHQAGFFGSPKNGDYVINKAKVPKNRTAKKTPLLTGEGIPQPPNWSDEIYIKDDMWLPTSGLPHDGKITGDFEYNKEPSPGQLDCIFRQYPRHNWLKPHLKKFASLCLNYNWTRYLQSKKNYHPKYWYLPNAFGDSDTSGQLPTQIVNFDEKLKLY